MAISSRRMAPVLNATAVKVLWNLNCKWRACSALFSRQKMKRGKMNRLTDEQLAEIEAANSRRSKGEWRIERVARDKPFPSDHLYVCQPHGAHQWGVCQILGEPDDDEQPVQADAKFIALASWAVPALVAEVRRLRQENAALRKESEAK